VFIPLLDREVTDKDLAHGYFIYGQESFPAHQFVDQLRALLLPANNQPVNFDRFWMDEANWTEVIDAARTAPLFISPWRLIVAEFLRREDDQGKNRPEDQLSEVEEKVLADYFASPSSRTVIAVIYPRSAWNAKSSPVFKFFTKRFPGHILSLESSPLRGKSLHAWLDRSLSERKLVLNPEAKARLEEVVGNDLQQLSSEMDKLISFSARKPVVEAEDVDLVCGWARNPENWELSEALTRADLRSCLEVLDSLFRSGEEEIKILNSVTRFFQEVLLANAWLREKTKDRKEIFRRFRPRISQKAGPWYENKLREYFGLVDSLSGQELGRLLDELSRIDRLVKSSDVSARILLESFMYEYCRRPKKAPVMRLGRS
jgi:DNA polymerase-3 subunit delta